MLTRRLITTQKKQQNNIANKFDEPLIVFSFDDAYRTDYTQAYPLFLERGIKGTSYAVSEWIDKPKFCTSAQLREMQIAGWDVQSHTKTHPDLATLDEIQLIDQFASVKNTFISKGLDEPKHLAYPYGSSNTLVKEVASQFYDTQRATGRLESGLNNRESFINSRYHDLIAISVDSHTSEQLDAFKRTILWGAKTGKIIVLYCHEVLDAYDGYDYAITKGNLIGLLDFISDLSIRTLTITELYNELIL